MNKTESLAEFHTSLRALMDWVELDPDPVWLASTRELVRRLKADLAVQEAALDELLERLSEVERG